MKSEPPIELFKAHRAALIDYAAPMVGCRFCAEDIVQDAFLRFSRRLADAGDKALPQRGEAIEHSVAYLYRIVRNLARDHIKRAKERQEVADPTAALEAVAASIATPEQFAVDRDRLHVVTEALDELPERTRKAFELHRLEGRTLQEIADHLDISLSRAHQLVKEALRHAAERLHMRELD